VAPREPPLITAAELLHRSAPAAISAATPSDNGEGPAMEVDEKTVRRIARLARIRISDGEAKSLQGELSGILDWVKQLDEVKTDGVAPMTRVVAMKLRQREDKVTEGENAEEVTRNAPVRDDHFFVVPKVVE
jgi:aspartyl-tRNA(Asn)/glutamyl-tRNA(Gln) amidotransferase subunit C